MKILTSGMSNNLAYTLGLIAREVGQLPPNIAGDEIDRGLILRRRLEEEGFTLSYESPPNRLAL